jgi:hypothetical protein
MENKIIVLTVCTKDQPNLFFWEYSVKKYNYNYFILGYNDAWKGWTYRTQLYIDKLKDLDPDTIAICCDANDLYFTLDSTILLNRFLDWENSNHDDKKIIVGAEPGCCTGEYDKNMVKNKQAFDICSKYTTNRYRFPNGGFLIGRASLMAEFYEKIIKNDDDQAEMLDMYIKDKNSFYLDTYNIFCGNIPPNNSHIAIAEEKYLYRNGGEEGLKIEFNNNWEIIDNKIINKNTKIDPCAIHFPGINGLGKWNIYIDTFNKLNNTNFSVNNKKLDYTANKARINNFYSNIKRYKWYIVAITLTLCIIIIFYNRRKNF